jgi:hypothetical protein
VKRLLAGAAMIAVVIAVYGLRLDDTAGLFKDDAYYVVLARAIASGQGYSLISSAATPVLPAFPPGFALLLAPIVAALPNFADSVVWLKVFSIVAMIATGVMTFQYFRDREIGAGRAATIALITVLTPGFVFLATSTVMSECAFTLAMIAGAVALERAGRADNSRTSRRAIVLAGVATTASWLIRGSGIAVVAGGMAFLLWKRRWSAAAGFAVVCAICYLPWSAYSTSHQSSEAARAAHGGDIVRYYHSPLVSKPGEPPIEPGIVSSRVSTNFVNVFFRDMGAVMIPGGYRRADESGLEVFLLAGSTGMRAGSMGIGPAFYVVSGIVTLFVIAGAFCLARRRIGVAEFVCAATIAMLLPIASHSFRYLLPIVPFLIGYFLVGVESIAARVRADAGASAFRIASGCLLFFLLIEHGQYIWMKGQEPPPLWIGDGREVRAVTDFVNSRLPADAKAASTNPGLLYLMTGREAVVYIEPRERWTQWKAAGIRYIVALHAVPQPNPSLGYRVIYESPRLGLWVLATDPRQR